jgi:hypothetical protein
MGILLVYDVTDEASFNNIRNWMRNIEQHASDNVNKVRLLCLLLQHSASNSNCILAMLTGPVSTSAHSTSARPATARGIEAEGHAVGCSFHPLA